MNIYWMLLLIVCVCAHLDYSYLPLLHSSDYCFHMELFYRYRFYYIKSPHEIFHSTYFCYNQ